METLKKFAIVGATLAVLVVSFTFSLLFASCDGTWAAESRYVSEARQAKYTSTYATIINKLEMKESNFETYRKVVFYNVRLGETVFACEGYCHVQVDADGDIEIVVRTGKDDYLRHYLGQKQDITYFSEQLEPTHNEDYRYQIVWNPKLWLPEFKLAN